MGGDRLFNILEELNLLDIKNYSTKDLQDVASRGKASYIDQGNYTKTEDARKRLSSLKRESSGSLTA